MIKKIGILCFWEFPEGMAPTTRILAYSKGLVLNGVQVEIFSFRRIFKSDVKGDNIQKSGIIDGIKFTYIHYFNDRGKTLRLIRIFDEIILRIRLIFMVSKSNRQKPFDCFLFSFDDLNSLSVYTNIFKVFPFPLIFVADEYPIPIRDFMRNSVPNNMMVKYKRYHKAFGLRILMSDNLKKFYNQNVSEKPTFILNTIVDSSRFEGGRIINVKPEYICYMGNMGLNKDNLDNIIKSFKLVVIKYNEIELHLYGTPSVEDRFILTELIKQLDLTEKVFLKGRARYSDVPKILKSAKILVNSQPKTLRAEGGFPTKLGEYLLSGKPALFTDSGEITKYITDNEHAFIAQPENATHFAQKILYILDNYEKSLEVAHNGKMFVKNNFDLEIVTKNMLVFLNLKFKN